MLHRSVGNVLFEGVVLSNLADLAGIHQDYDRENELQLLSLAIHERCGDRLSAGIILHNRSYRLHAQGELAEAEAGFRDCPDIFAHSGPLMLVIAHRNLGVLLAESAQLDDAVHHLQQALELSAANPHAEMLSSPGGSVQGTPGTHRNVSSPDGTYRRSAREQ